MAMRVSYGSRARDLDTHRGVVGGARQIARPPCSSLGEAIDAIKADIRAGEETPVPECTTSEITLGWDAVLELHRPTIGPYSEGGEHDLPESFKTGWTEGDENDEGAGKSYPTAILNDITTAEDQKARSVVQRAASRGIVAAIERADGFKYSMNNAWAAKDADGMRFSYICQDSMQNKDRHANGFTRTLKHLKGEHERGPRKATYDCKGSVSIKCSMIRRSIDIFYRHYAIHSSVAERKNLPPPPRGRTSTSGDAAEQGGLVERLQKEETAWVPPPSHGGSNIGRPLKRKRDEDTPSKSGKPLSLFELLKQSEASEKSEPQTPDKAPPTQTSTHPPPMNYDLPSWQTPLPPPPVVQAPRSSQSLTAALPYQPPYQQPNSQQTPQQVPIPRQHPSSASSLTWPQQASSNTYSQPTTAPGPNTNAAMFATLKPVPKESPLTLYSGRTRSSCTNCRYGKKKCDETRPICSNCAKSGKFDCAYDGAYGYPASAAQQAQMGGWSVQSSKGVQMAPPVTPEGYMQQQQHQQQQRQGYGQQYGSQPSQQQQGQYGAQPSTQRQSPYQHQHQQAVPPISQHEQHTNQQGQRAESPDPWFPKR